MREIKFRSWNADHGAVTDCDTVLVEATFSSEYLRCQDREIMQYTGIKDSRGTEIYEGDVVEYATAAERSRVRSVVIFERGAFCVRHQGGCGSYVYPLWNISGLTVVGNVYESPELLNYDPRTDCPIAG